MELQGLYKRRKSVLPSILLLATLMIFSSCTVVNALQAQLNVPPAQKLNPSKATLSTQTICEYSDYVTVVNSGEKNDHEQPHSLLPSTSTLLPSLPPYFNHQPLTISVGWSIANKVPVYILYQKMKLWV